jgi:hypothetical protein
VLRPYRTSKTYQNLLRTGEGVFHVTDDVLLLAQTAVGEPHPLPQLQATRAIAGMILTGACRWYAFRTVAIDDAEQRTVITAEVVDRGRLREFFGFNRAKHAVLEAAILATRIGLLPADEITAQFEKLRVLVEKTGGAQEHEAFQFLESHLRRTLASGSAEVRS